MKFKVIFIAFNVIIVFSFLFIFFMPVIVLGWEYSELFWSNNWLLALVFVFIIGALNLYFGLNWRLFSLLEKEDWPGLTQYLEQRVYTQHRVTKQNVRILINGYVVTANTAAVERLESHVRARSDALLRHFALEFGVPRLLRNDPVEMEEYFGELAAGDGVRNADWIKWNHAFALMTLRKNDDAKKILSGLIDDVDSPVLLVLTLYLLDAYAGGEDELREKLEGKKRWFREKYDARRWERELEKNRGNLEVLVLSRLLEDATQKLFPGLAAAGATRRAIVGDSGQIAGASSEGRDRGAF